LKKTKKDIENKEMEQMLKDSKKAMLMKTLTQNNVIQKPQENYTNDNTVEILKQFNNSEAFKSILTTNKDFNLNYGEGNVSPAREDGSNINIGKNTFIDKS